MSVAVPLKSLGMLILSIENLQLAAHSEGT